MCTVIFKVLSLSTVFLTVTPVTLASVTHNETNNYSSKSTGPCILPDYPEHGSYTVPNAPNAVPGQGFNTVELYVTCKPGYGTVEERVVYCDNGNWSQKLPQCIRFCKLDRHPSVRYSCLVTGTSASFRPCRNYELHGTRVHPTCNSPDYYTPMNFNHMNCIDGEWDYIATCFPECGKLIWETQNNFNERWSAKLASSLPWYVAIYKKTSSPYKQFCTGYLIVKDIVISAAHCFWNGFDRSLLAENYAVAIDKIHLPSNSPQDQFAQMSDVMEISILPRILDEKYQEDIAIVKLVTPIQYETYMRPICSEYGLGF